MVEHERDPEQRDALGERALEHDPQIPSSRPRRLEERPAAGLPECRRPARGQQRRGAAVEDRLGRGQRQDEVALQQQRVDLQREPVDRPDLDQGSVLDVVHLDAAVKSARQLVRAEPLALPPARRPPLEAARDEERLPLGGDTQALELVHDGEQRVLARIGLRRGHRQGGMVEHDRRRAAGSDQSLQRLAREREADGVPNGRADLRHRLDRRRRPEHDRVVGHVDDRDPRSRQHRDLHGMDRYSRRNVVRNPRFGQKREAGGWSRASRSRSPGSPAPAPARSTPSVSATPMPEPRASGRVTAKREVAASPAGAPSP